MKIVNCVSAAALGVPTLAPAQEAAPGPWLTVDGDILGSLIGLVAILVAALLVHWTNLRRDDRERERNAKSIAALFKTEISSLILNIDGQIGDMRKRLAKHEGVDEDAWPALSKAYFRQFYTLPPLFSAYVGHIHLIADFRPRAATRLFSFYTLHRNITIGLLEESPAEVVSELLCRRIVFISCRVLANGIIALAELDAFANDKPLHDSFETTRQEYLLDCDPVQVQVEMNIEPDREPEAQNLANHIEVFDAENSIY